MTFTLIFWMRATVLEFFDEYIQMESKFHNLSC